MSRFLVSLVLLTSLVAFLYTSTASAACEGIDIGAEFISKSYYINNSTDYDSDESDSIAKTELEVNIKLINTYTDKIKTNVTITSTVDDAEKGSLYIDYAYIEIQDFLLEDLNLKIGKYGMKWEMRKSFALPGLTDALDFDMSFLPDTKPVGFVIDYKIGSVDINFMYGKIVEESEAGNNSNDIDEIFIRFTKKFEDGDLGLYGYFWNDNNSAENDKFYTVGLYVDWSFMDGSLDIWADLCLQDGDTYDSADEMGNYRFWGGFDYTFDAEVVPHLGLDFLYIGGQDDETYAFQMINEDVDRTFIVEARNILPQDGEGYFSTQVAFGLANIADGKYEAAATLTYFMATGDLPGDREDAIGLEFDIAFIWHYAEDICFTVGLGHFFPDEDFVGKDPDGITMLILAIILKF